ncbi:hypothetical protein ACHAXT_007201 [Thalassiosira profunda]
MDASRAERGVARPRSRPSSTGSGNSNNLIHTALHTTAKRSSSTPPLFRTVTWILIVLCSSFLTFYLGIWAGLQAAKAGGATAAASTAECPQCKCAPCPPPAEAKEKPCTSNVTPEELQRKVEERAKQKIDGELEDLCKKLPQSAAASPQQPAKRKKDSILFSKSISHFARGLVRVGKDDLMNTFDFGVPPNAGSEEMDALILYNKEDAMPSDEDVASAARYNDPTKPLPKLSAKDATENCESMNVVLIDNPSGMAQCFALVGGQYQSYHVQRWMRRGDYGGLKANMPLKLSSRGLTGAGRLEFYPPRETHVKKHQEKLLTYLTNISDIKSRLSKVLEKMNTKAVVVMTCNHGQSELLMNFACAARSRGFDISNVLVFPTDLETKELAEGVGLTTFYEEKMMASIPKEGSSGVLCVQLVNELGYDLLFSDVDMDKSLPEFDMYFQDDGSRQERYAPYSANTGFYFVRSNEKTKNFFRHFIYTSDLIYAWNSHQQALIAMLSEHNSLMGLTVKIFAKELEEFPGGLQFHRKVEPMKKILAGESNAYVFHMSWTNNKDNKVKFFQQMGEWYLNKQCIGKEMHEITGEKGASNEGALVQQCCSAEPLITCHYKDKPSKNPCPDAPCIDKKCKSFW